MDHYKIARLEAAMQRRLDALPLRIRPFTRSQGELPRACMLVGPRGVGKTTFLLHHARKRRLLYLSADNPFAASEHLYETVHSIFLTGFEGVIIDEVHFARDWSRHLKALYDDFPKHLLWISDSSALVLRGGVGDLSRRFVPIMMPLLSFREFLFLETGMEYPVHDAFAGENKLPVQPGADILDAFRMYRECGTRPFYGEGNFSERMFAVLDKTLYGDVPFFLPQVTDGNLRLMKAIVATLSGSSIPRLHVRSLCTDWGIGAEKLYQILEVMESVGVIRIIRYQNDSKARSAGAKLFFSDPVFYSLLAGDPGTAREALVAALCSAAGWNLEAARDETKGDFVLSKTNARAGKVFMVEVGGRSKQAKQADFVVRDDIEYPAGRAVPLWLLGMGY